MILLRRFTPFLFLLLCSLAGCMGDPTEETSLDEPWPIEEETQLALVPSVEINRADLVFADGTRLFEEGAESPETEAAQTELKNRIRLLTDRAYRLGTPSPQVYPAGADPELEPAQDRLVYVYGSKTIAARRTALDHVSSPTTSIPSTCQKRLFGLDCSGLVYLAAINADLDLRVQNAAGMGNVSNWNAALPANSLLEFVSLPFEGTSLQTGDILTSGEKLNQSEHVGIVGRTADGELVVFQSNGSYRNTCEQNDRVEEDGIVKWRGPRSIRIDQIPPFFTENRSIIRLQVKPESMPEPMARNLGIWQLDVKCLNSPRTITSATVCLELSPSQRINVGCYVSTAESALELTELRLNLDSERNLSASVFLQEPRTYGELLNYVELFPEPFPFTETGSMDYIPSRHPGLGIWHSPESFYFCSEHEFRFFKLGS